MNLTPETVAIYEDLLDNPGKYNCSYKPLKDCFVSCDEAIAKHILFKQYKDYLQKPLPKVMFYIIMDKRYQISLAPDGNLGYNVKLSV